MKLTTNFYEHEFADPNTGECKMDRAFVERLQAARTIAGIPFIITSGYRTKETNDAVGGAPKSAHLIGHAADIAWRTPAQLYYIVNSLMRAGFSRIEIGKRHVHVDDNPGHTEGVMWLAPGK